MDPKLAMIAANGAKFGNEMAQNPALMTALLEKKNLGFKSGDLKAISDLHPIVPLILSYRKYSKLLNTYIDSFESFKFADNRIHAMFNQSSTMTGRLSSSQPNLQNLSVRDDERKIIRKFER